MEKIKYISKQWSLTARDWLKSLFYGAIVPSLVTIQGVIEAGGINDLNWSLIAKIAIGSILAHLIRKLVEPSKEVQIVKLASNENGGNSGGDNNGGGNNNPPPLGDPLKPTKP